MHAAKVFEKLPIVPQYSFETSRAPAWSMPSNKGFADSIACPARFGDPSTRLLQIHLIQVVAIRDRLILNDKNMRQKQKGVVFQYPCRKQCNETKQQGADTGTLSKVKTALMTGRSKRVHHGGAGALRIAVTITNPNSDSNKPRRTVNYTWNGCAVDPLLISAIAETPS